MITSTSNAKVKDVIRLQKKAAYRSMFLKHFWKSRKTAGCWKRSLMKRYRIM